MAGPLNPLTVGLAFDGDEPRVLISMAQEWRTLPYATAHLFVRMIVEILDTIRPPAAAEMVLTHCPEYGPYTGRA